MLRRMTSKDLRDRTMRLAVAIHQLVTPLFRQCQTRHSAIQLFRASTSVAANYRAACLGRSRREFVAKIGTVREEADETVFWLSFMGKAGIVPSADAPEAARLKDEAQQLARIFAATYRTARKKLIEERRARRAAKPQSPGGNPPSPMTA
jgi:four helix bundle protein